MIDPQNQNQNVPNLLSEEKGGVEPKESVVSSLENPAKNEKKEGESIEIKKGQFKSEKSSGKQIFIGFISFILGLIAIAYGFILWSLIEGRLSNPLFEMLGMEPGELKAMLLTITNSLFGFLSLIFIIATLVKFFQWMMTSSESELKKLYLKKMGGFFVILAFLVSIWVGLYWLIVHAETNPISKNNAETLIVTSPESVIGLTAPILVKFDIGEKLYQKVPKKFIRQIEWDLNGDGQYGDASGATITYRFFNRGKDNGRFLIKAKVYYFSESANEERTYLDEIKVIITNEEVKAVLDANIFKGAVPLTVKFSADGSVDPDGNIIQYEWDFDGDDVYEVRGEDKMNVTHTFKKMGEHKVQLRVTGQNNDYAIASEVIKATAAEEKIRAEIVSPNVLFEGTRPLTISLDGSQSYSKNGSIIKYEWLVKGEENNFIGRVYERTFADPGEYEVTLIVENEEGDRDMITQNILVYEKRSVVITTSSEKDDNGEISGVMPFEVTFDSEKSEIPRAVEWKWDFENDGIYDSLEQKVDHIFEKSGEYEVKLTIVDANDQEFSTIQKVLVADEAASASIIADPSDGDVPLTVEFDGSGSRTSVGKIIDYIWEFEGERPIHYGGKISREFRAVGVFPVRLTILTSEGEKASKEIFISVRGQALQAAFEASPLAGDAPLEVRFNSQKSTGNIKEYHWDFGDGKNSYLSNPKHIYSIPGDYIVKLRVIDSRNIISEAERVISVTKAVGGGE